MFSDEAESKPVDAVSDLQLSSESERSSLRCVKTEDATDVVFNEQPMQSSHPHLIRQLAATSSALSTLGFEVTIILVKHLAH